MSDDELYLLKMTAFHASNPGDRARALAEYANILPDDPEWRDFLFSELRTSTARSYLQMITLFPDIGLFAAAEVLGLTDHSDYYTRGVSLEVIGLWFVESNFRPSDPKVWVKVLERRLSEPNLGSDCLREDAIPYWKCFSNTCIRIGNTKDHVTIRLVTHIRLP